MSLSLEATSSRKLKVTITDGVSKINEYKKLKDGSYEITNLLPKGAISNELTTFTIDIDTCFGLETGGPEIECGARVDEPNYISLEHIGQYETREDRNDVKVSWRKDDIDTKDYGIFITHEAYFGVLVFDSFLNIKEGKNLEYELVNGVLSQREESTTFDVEDCEMNF